MLECLLVGDSAVIDMKKYMSKCEIQAEHGITSEQFNKTYPNSFYADTVIISLGSNDHRYVDSFTELFEMRQRVGAKNVFWVLPNEETKEIVKEVADYYGDIILRK